MSRLYSVIGDGGSSSITVKQMVASLEKRVSQLKDIGMISPYARYAEHEALHD
jgi:hypothetical protein